MTAGTPPPSGGQVTLRHSSAVATVVEVGGGLRTFSVGDRDILDGYPADERCSGGRGQPLLPWPNRLAGGRYQFDGLTVQADLSEPTTGNAIHGLTRWRSWTPSAVDDDHVTMTHRLRPSPSYPWDLRLAISYRLGADGLSVRLTAHNESPTACPFAAGFHPYLSAGGGLVDDLRVTVPAGRELVTDERGIPTGSRPVSSPLDGSRIADRVVDTCYSPLERGPDGRAVVTVGEDTVWMDEAWGHVMVFTGDTLAPGRRRRGMAVEPMTAAPDAFNNGDGLLVLHPGEHFEGSWGITPGRW